MLCQYRRKPQTETTNQPMSKAPHRHARRDQWTAGCLRSRSSAGLGCPELSSSAFCLFVYRPFTECFLRTGRCWRHCGPQGERGQVPVLKEPTFRGREKRKFRLCLSRDRNA